MWGNVWMYIVLCAYIEVYIVCTSFFLLILPLWRGMYIVTSLFLQIHPWKNNFKKNYLEKKILKFLYIERNLQNFDVSMYSLEWGAFKKVYIVLFPHVRVSVHRSFSAHFWHVFEWGAIFGLFYFLLMFF